MCVFHSYLNSTDLVIFLTLPIRRDYDSLVLELRPFQIPKSKDPKAARGQAEEFNTVAKMPPHPNICPLVGCTIHLIDSGFQVWLVLPFLDGGSLEQKIKNEAQTPWCNNPTNVMAALRDMFTGLRHLHQLKPQVIHRDCMQCFSSPHPLVYPPFPPFPFSHILF